MPIRVAPPPLSPDPTAAPAPAPLLRLPEVNGLRAIAILAVLYQHYSWAQLGPFNPDSPIRGVWLPLRALLESGWLGVNLFFVLSGLVLYLPYAQGQRRMAGWQDASSFLKHRMARLLPLYYLSGAVSLSLGVFAPFEVGRADHWLQLLGFLTITFPFTADSFMPPYNWVLWSLGIEIWFSVIFPALLWLYSRHRAATLAGATLLACGLRAWGYSRMPMDGNLLNWITDSLPARLPDFLAGMLLADLVLRRTAILRRWASLVLGGGLVWGSVVLWHLWCVGAVPMVSAAGFTLLFDLGCLLGIGFLLSHPTPLNRLLRLAPVQVVGMMCYSLYVWHGMILYRLIMVPIPDFPDRLAALPVYLAAVFALAALSYRYVEFGHRPAGELFLLPRRRG
ncbi:acyltransferase (plasmid) [Azospirillum sp. TSA2s]|nr:acyltransferase [Azospirillum sp. TSA2s]